MVPLANDALDGVLTLAGGAIGLIYLGLPGSIMGAAVGAFISLLVTLVCGAYWHKFTFPLPHLLKIAAATAAMVLALGMLPIAATTPSLVLAVAVGASVYGAVLAALCPAEAGVAVSKLRRFVGT